MIGDDPQNPSSVFLVWALQVAILISTKMPSWTCSRVLKFCNFVVYCEEKCFVSDVSRKQLASSISSKLDLEIFRELLQKFLGSPPPNRCEFVTDLVCARINSLNSLIETMRKKTNSIPQVLLRKSKQSLVKFGRSANTTIVISNQFRGIREARNFCSCGCYMNSNCSCKYFRMVPSGTGSGACVTVTKTMTHHQAMEKMSDEAKKELEGLTAWLEKNSPSSLSSLSTLSSTSTSSTSTSSTSASSAPSPPQKRRRMDDVIVID